jgi:1,4-dihydroxy-2-naphthoyl-CoA hydrolase
MSGEDRSALLQKAIEGFFPGLLEVRFASATPERIVAEIVVRRDLCTLPGRAHGGALMAFADTLGACGAVLNLPQGAGTTTLESKTNFFAAGPEGATLRGEATPLHIGRRTMVWQTRITAGDALVALVTQTQMVLPPREG